MEGTNEGQQDKENDGSSRDDGVVSHAYQHVDEDETCDDTAWDDAGGGGGTEGRRKDYMMNDDDDGHDDKMADDNMTMADGHYQLREAKDNVNGDGDGVMEGDDISDDVIEEEEINVDEKNEREIPIDNFYNTPLTASSDMRSMDEARLREYMKTSLQYIHSNPQVADGECIRLWMTYEQMTSSLSHSLCEELRLILTPTETAQLKGDYRSGKRLNMRRIISYIASNFQNDRIWLKRCKPSKRDYQVLIAVDDSSSMMENNCGQMTYESLALISTSLQRLECGQLGICRFGEDVDVLHSFDNSFSSFHGGHVLKNLSFTQNKTNFVKLLQCAVNMFGESLLKGRQSSVNINQLLVILSDGWIFADGTSPIERGIRDLNDMGVFTVFIIIDQGKVTLINTHTTCKCINS
jgi:midasin